MYVTQYTRTRVMYHQQFQVKFNRDITRAGYIYIGREFPDPEGKSFRNIKLI